MVLVNEDLTETNVFFKKGRLINIEQRKHRTEDVDYTEYRLQIGPFNINGQRVGASATVGDVGLSKFVKVTRFINYINILTNDGTLHYITTPVQNTNDKIIYEDNRFLLWLQLLRMIVIVLRLGILLK